MRGTSTRGYVLKVVASASIATLTACEGSHPVGSVAHPPQPIVDSSDAGATATPPTPAPPEVGTIAQPPDAPVASAPVRPTPSVLVPPLPTARKVGTIANSPDATQSPTVGTTAHAPDAKH